MKLLIPILASALILNAQARPDRTPIDESTAKAVKEFLLKQGSLELDDDFKQLDKVFKGAAIYEVWIKHPSQKGSSLGVSLSVLKQGDRIEVFTSGRDAAISLIEAYEGKVTSADEVRDLLSAITPVTEIKEPEKGTYHVYNGEDFFDKPSGFIVKVKDGKIESCTHALKLEKDK